MVKSKNEKVLGKPDFENESFRMWELDKDEAGRKKVLNKIEKEKDDENTISVKMGDIDLKLMGFNIAMNEKGQKVFAYKIKEETETILYYIPDGLETEDQKIAKEAVEIMRGNPFRFKMVDVRDTIKAIENEKHIIDKIDKKNGGKNETKN